MAANLMRHMRLCRNWGLLLLGLAPALVVAQELVDPTRPPDELRAHAGAETNPLQSVIISPSRRAAIIRGQTVELGEKIGDVRLIEVNESGVVLQGAKGLEVLTLFPGVKIDRKAMVLPMMEGAGHPARKTDSANPSGQSGGKEAK